MNRQGAIMGILKEIRNKTVSLFFKKDGRTCIKCHETKDIEEFYKSRRSKDNYALRYTTECKECSLKNRREHYVENKERIMDSHRFRSYGITKEEYGEMLQDQDGKCAICKREESACASITKKVRALAVDHCHVTGNVRGLLCRACNLGIGHFGDNLGTLEEAIKYLESTDVQTTT
jgi:hypothetical protein